VRRSRRSVLSAAALGLALAATGCTYMSPVQTKDFYQAADGTNANIEQNGALLAGVRNAVLVVGEDGTPVLSATVANYSAEELTVSVEGLDGGSSIFSADVQVPAQGAVGLGTGEGREVVPIGAIDAVPGTILDLEVTAGGESTSISLPVIDSSLEYYGTPEPAAG